MTDFSPLQTLPEGVADALDLIQRFDDCLAIGFSRLGEAEREGLTSFTDAFAGSPLHDSVQDGVELILRSEYVPSAFLALGAGRAAMFGAVHDALRGQVQGVLGFSVDEAAEERPAQPPGDAATLLASTQQWLLELAVAGFKHFDASQLTPFSATLEQVQSTESLAGLSVLLTGTLDEWLVGIGLETLPVQRWADLWTAAMVGSQQLVGERAFEAVSGLFYPLGVDTRIHQHVISARIYGVFENRAATLTFSSYKVGVINGDEVWKLFRPAIDPILKALEGHASLRILLASEPATDNSG